MFELDFIDVDILILCIHTIKLLYFSLIKVIVSFYVG